MIRELKRLWTGEVPLPEAFWWYGIAWALAVNVTTSVLFFALYTKDASPLLLVPAYILPLPVNLFILVAVWRSAGRYDGPAKWATWARLGTLAWVMLLCAT